MSNLSHDENEFVGNARVRYALPTVDFKKLCATVRSEASPSQRRENFKARLRISFQERGMR